MNGENQMEVAQFAEIQEELTKRVSSVIYCNLSTVNTEGRPRSRVVHPVWEGTIGWLDTRPGSHKLKHLAQNPFVSLAYVSATTPVYIDCKAEWIDDMAEKERVWNYIASLPAPYGYDPALIFKTFDDASFGLLKLIPWRIELAQFPGKPLVWRQAI
jgi:hypothetical protein